MQYVPVCKMRVLYIHLIFKQALKTPKNCNSYSDPKLQH